MISTTAIIKDYFSYYQGIPKASWQNIFLNFTESFLAAIYYFLAIYFVDVLHMNISTAGLLISFYGMGTILGGYIGGRLSDKFSARLVSTISLCIQAINFLMLTQIKISFFIAINLFILGIATYSFITANYVSALSHSSDSESKLKIINLLSVASNLGIGLAALIIGELATHHFERLFYFSGILLLFLVFLLATQKNPPLPINKNDKKIRKNLDLKKSNKTKKQSLALISLFFTGLIVNQISTTYPLFIKESFPLLGIQAFSMLFMLNTLLIIIFQNYLVNKLHHYNTLMMVGIGSFLIGTGMFLLNFLFSIEIAILACIIYSMGEMIFFSMVQFLCYQQGSENQKGRSLGTYRTVYAFSRFVGPTLGSSIYFYIGENIVWYLSGLIGLIFLILCKQYKD